MSAKGIDLNQIFDQQFQNKKQELEVFIEIGIELTKVAYFHAVSKQYIGFQSFDLNSNGNWSVASKNLEKAILVLAPEKYKSVKITIADALYTLVPQSLFEENKIIDFLSFNHPIEDESQFKFYFKKIESQQTVLIYAIPRSLAFMLKAKLPLFEISHFAEPLIEVIGIDQWTNKQLIVHIQQSRFEVIYIPKGKLTFFNSFEYKSTEDFIYFLLYVMEQLNLDREVVELNLAGEFEENSAIYETLYKYIRSVKIMDRTKNVSFSTVLSQLPEQYHYSLFNKHLCE